MTSVALVALRRPRQKGDSGECLSWSGRPPSSPSPYKETLKGDVSIGRGDSADPSCEFQIVPPSPSAWGDQFRSLTVALPSLVYAYRYHSGTRNRSSHHA